MKFWRNLDLTWWVFLRHLWSRWRAIVTTVITTVALGGVYFVGIGLTSLVGKGVGRQFLRRRFSQSSWQPMTGSRKLTRMY